MTLTYEEQELLRQDRLNEKGTAPPCPLCGRPRVQRSDYIRCNPCGMNWLKGEDLTKDARLSREPYLRTKGIKPGPTEPSDTAQTANPSTKH
jgi:hypothetical protein